MSGWRKSSHSTATNCIEAGTGPGVVGVRDSALIRAGLPSPVLEFTAAAWSAFTSALKAG